MRCRKNVLGHVLLKSGSFEAIVKQRGDAVALGQVQEVGPGYRRREAEMVCDVVMDFSDSGAVPGRGTRAHRVPKKWQSQSAVVLGGLHVLLRCIGEGITGKGRMTRNSVKISGPVFGKTCS